MALFEEYIKEVNRLRQINAELLEACKAAFELSCERSESKKKWTIKDQDAHDMLKQAISRAEGRE